MLAGAWNAIRARHHDVPPVVLVIGSRSDQSATRCRLGHFSPLRWLPPPNDRGTRELEAAADVVKKAMSAGELPELQATLQASATAVLQSALQISSDAKASLSEVLITQDGLNGRAADVLATLLPWRRGRIQTLGMPSCDRASSRSACWNVGNPKGCQSDVGNLDGCPRRVISTGGCWMWNLSAAATATSTASKTLLNPAKRRSVLPPTGRGREFCVFVRLSRKGAAVSGRL